MANTALQNQDLRINLPHRQMGNQVLNIKIPLLMNIKTLLVLMSLRLLMLQNGLKSFIANNAMLKRWFKEIACPVGSQRLSCGVEVRDSYDSTAIGAELCYMASGATGCYGVLFSNMMAECRDSEYSDYCGNCRNVFGCVALLNKSFCVFNKQYSEDEYWKLVDEIKTNMIKSGEYGEFFPPHLSPFPYQASVMASYKGYDDFDNAKKYGYRFEEIPEENLEINVKVLETDNVPDDINNTDDTILNELIFDKKNNKLFRYTKIELDFRRKFGLPLPREHFTARLKKKREKFGSIDLKFYERTCPVCKSKFETAYSPEDPRIVYCESCYLKEIV